MLSVKLRAAFSAVLLVFLGAGVTRLMADELLDAMPADATFCVRLNSFDATMGKLDQFLAGISPVPGGAAMAVRGQLAAILGNPALPGIDTAGHVGGYGKLSREVLAGNVDPCNPAAMGFFGVLLPVKDYDAFISSNPNCGQPDEKGVSKIKAGPLGELAAIRAGSYALVTAAQDYDELVTESQRISSGSGAGISSVLGATIADNAQKQPIWICANWGAVTQQINQQAGSEQSQQPQSGPVAAMASQADISALAAIAPYASITVNPQPELVSVRAELFASTQTPASGASLKNSPLIAEMTKKIGASTVQEAGDKLAQVTKLIGDAANADYVGTFPLPAEMAMPAPGTQPQAMSPVVYAIKLGDNGMAVDMAVPKASAPALAGAAAMTLMGLGMFGKPEITISEGDMGGAMEMPNLKMEADESLEVVEASPEMTVTIDPAVGGYVIEPMVGINGVRFGAAAAQLKQVLGEPKAVSGRMYQYFDSGFYVVTDSNDKIDAIYCGALNSADMVAACTCKTKQNIAMGSSKDDLTNAYGKPTHIYEYSDKGTVRYEYDNIKSQFVLKDSKVVHMIFRKPG